MSEKYKNPFSHFPQTVSISSQIRFDTVQHLGNRYLICRNCPIIIVPVLRDIVEIMTPTTHKIQLSVVLFSLFYLHDPKNEISQFVCRDIKCLCSSMQMCFHYVRDIQFDLFLVLLPFCMHEQNLFSHVTVRYNAKYRL